MKSPKESSGGKVVKIKKLPSNRLKIGISLATDLIRIEIKLKKMGNYRSIRPGGSNGHFNIHVELFGCLATSQNLLYLP